MAACFWWPPLVFWYWSMMPWLSPLFPGWNCIVMAKPMFWCSDDWSDWDVWATWNIFYNWDFWYINWNCKKENEKQYLDTDYANKYYKYLNWSIADSDVWSIDWAITSQNSANVWPLFTLNWWSWEEVNIDFDIDNPMWAFDDVVKIVQKRISAFLQ